MKTAVIIQARMGSARFPGKVLADLNGQPVIEHVVERCQQSIAEDVVVASGGENRDCPIRQWCKDHLVQHYAGDEFNVLERIYLAARPYEAIVRVCCDCPLIDPKDIDTLISYWTLSQCHYVAFQLSNGTPALLSQVGMPELISTDALGLLCDHVDWMQEHVTWGAYNTTGLAPVWLKTDRDPNERNTIDTPEDLERIAERCKSSLEVV